MVKKTVSIVFLVLQVCLVCYGQTSFQGLTVGASTFYSDDAQRTAYYNPQNRAYQTRFLKSQSAFIIWELVLEYPPPGRRIPYTIETNYYDAQGTFIDKQTSSFCFIEGSGTTSFCSNGAGVTTPGAWAISIYRVELSIDGQTVATGSFEVY